MRVTCYFVLKLSQLFLQSMRHNAVTLLRPLSLITLDLWQIMTRLFPYCNNKAVTVAESVNSDDIFHAGKHNN